MTLVLLDLGISSVREWKDLRLEYYATFSSLRPCSEASSRAPSSDAATNHGMRFASDKELEAKKTGVDSARTQPLAKAFGYMIFSGPP